MSRTISTIASRKLTQQPVVPATMNIVSGNNQAG
jgi:hypothetical protein